MTAAKRLIDLTDVELRKLIAEEVARVVGQAKPANDYLRRDELAEILGVTARTIRNWEAEGLPVIRAGGTIRYDREAVTEWLDANSRQKLRRVK